MALSESSRSFGVKFWHLICHTKKPFCHHLGFFPRTLLTLGYPCLPHPPSSVAELGSPSEVSSSLSAAVIKHWPKATWEGQGLLTYVSQSQTITEGSQGRNTSWSWSRDCGGMLPTSLLPTVCQACSCKQLRAISLGVGSTSHSGLCPLTSIKIKTMPPQI